MDKEDFKALFIITVLVTCIPLVAMSVIGGVAIMFQGWAYREICKEQGIDNIIKCGIIAPNFGQEVFINYPK